MPPEPAPEPAARSSRPALAAIAALVLAIALGGCATGHPKPLGGNELAEAQSFPYYRVYWVGPSFAGHPLAAADGLRNYIPGVGDSVYYGDCVRNKGVFGGGSCLLPLQVTTVIYGLHSNASLGPQQNMVIRGVPATVYDEGRSIELYSGRVAIDVFSYDYAHALHAAERLLPVNAPGAASEDLPPPVYCPGLSGAVPVAVTRTLAALPKHVCQQSAAELAYTRQLLASR